ncbi:MAG TPA: hypothetical protein VM925_01565 [Labilithrix sp.]|nr:hypothetical protein [Labilithrix sp.]
MTRRIPLRKAIARAAALTTCVGALFATATAHAEESSPYCRKVRARAASDAALLFAPTVQAQGIKFPNNGTVDSGVTTGAGYQFRAALTFSPLDFYKGFRVKSVGEADCQQHEHIVTTREILMQGSDYGRLPALRKQVEFLDGRRDEMDGTVEKTTERVAAHVASIRDAAEVRARIAVLMRAREQSQGDADRLVARGVEAFHGSLLTLVAAAEQDAMKFEREASHVRTLDAWDLRLTGGVIPQDRPVDYFGIVQVGFNFGSFSRNAQESRYLEARSDEMKKARYELRDEVQKFRAQLKTASAQAKRELAIVDKQAAMLVKDKESLEGSDSAGAAQALALISLDSILVESERVYLNTLITELARLENDNGR